MSCKVYNELDYRTKKKSRAVRKKRLREDNKKEEEGFRRIVSNLATVGKDVKQTKKETNKSRLKRVIGYFS